MIWLLNRRPFFSKGEENMRNESQVASASLKPKEIMAICVAGACLVSLVCYLGFGGGALERENNVVADIQAHCDGEEGCDPRSTMGIFGFPPSDKEQRGAGFGVLLNLRSGNFHVDVKRGIQKPVLSFKPLLRYALFG